MYSPLTSEIFSVKTIISNTATSSVLSTPSSTYFLTDFYLSNQASPNPNSLILYCGQTQIYRFSLAERGGAVINLNQTTPIICNNGIFAQLSSSGTYDLTINGFQVATSSFNAIAGLSTSTTPIFTRNIAPEQAYTVGVLLVIAGLLFFDFIRRFFAKI